MRIAYLTTTPLPSEKANVIQSVEMARALCEAGAEVAFFCPKADKDKSDVEVQDWLEKYFNWKMPFTLRFSRHRTFKDRFGAMLCIPELIRSAFASGKFDCFYLRNSYMLYAMTILGQPVAYEQHQWQAYADERRSEMVRKFALWAAKRRSCKLFICISEELRQRWVQKGVPEVKTLTAHDGVDLVPFTPMLSRREARIILDLPGEGVIVSYVGSLYGNRAINDVLAAAGEYPNVRFRFVGGPEKEQQGLQAFATKEELANVKFLGRLDRAQVSLQLFASDVLLFTMNEKTLTFDICSPMKVFEYMASGRLIVAPDLPSMREVLRQPYAFLYEFPKAEDMAKKIGEAIAVAENGESESRGLVGRKVVEEQYSWRLRAESILTRLCGNIS